ncbi:MAG: class I SAM-dependent methyltransferase [Leptonema illini]|uniref:Class I SAM-dependent methyltransferase n=1 Tax=Leptonema illini TaxID=183 RepID=A0A833LXG0_9LEPT|nr:MAG: class I SAM-dependent methyltransferase [Leptonema illini]PKL34489.1 MAG: SAM-dependent methyltransferase [Spirochaetae bacterium HGW-Spirochaetae-10]
MAVKISPRLAAIVAALPIRKGMRILEIGCGPGAAAREICARYDDVSIVAIDRSAKAIAQARANSAKEMSTGRLQFRCVAIEDFELEEGEELFDLAFAVRVGALDGRHPEAGVAATRQLRKALKKNGKLSIDGVLHEKADRS